MRILMLSSTYRPEVRGVATVVEQYLIALTRRGHSVYLVTRRLKGTPLCERFSNIFIYRVYPHVLSWNLYPKFLIGQLLIARYLTRKIKFDVIHVITNSPLIPAVFLKMFYGLPLVFSPIGIPTERLLRRPKASVSAKFAYSLNRLLLSLLLRMLDRVIVPSEFTKRFLIGFYGKGLSQKIRIIPRCVNTDDFKFYPKRRHGKRAPFPKILCVGALWYRKGIDTLLKAMPEVIRGYPQASLKIVGQGNKSEYLELAEKLKIISAIHLTGTIPHEKISPLYREADIFVLPSRHLGETFGNAVLEAMASGRPVIATKVGALPHLVKHGETGMLVEPENPHELARAIIYLASNEDLLRKMGANGRRVVEEKYNLEFLAEKLEKIYQAL